jgi:hypothetical protein
MCLNTSFDETACRKCQEMIPEAQKRKPESIPLSGHKGGMLEELWKRRK